MSSVSMNFTDGCPGSVHPEQRVLFRRLGGQLAVNALKVMIEKQRLRFVLIIVQGVS